MLIVRIKMPRGTDEVNYGGVAYPVSKIDGIIEVPAAVAVHLLKTGGARDMTPQPEPSDRYDATARDR